MTRTRKDRRGTHNTRPAAVLTKPQRELLAALAMGKDETWQIKDSQYPQIQSLINMGLIWFSMHERFEVTRLGLQKLNEQKQKPA